MARAELPALCLALVVWAAVVGPGSLRAQGGAPSGDPPTGGASASVESEAAAGSHLEILLMTIGPGDLTWERFSHNALVIRDHLAQTEVAYNWGMFDFKDADFWPRLARGRMRYFMQGFPASTWLAQ